MRKSLNKSIFNSILSLSLVVFFLASCSADDKDPAVVFTSLDANKTETYTEGTIILNLAGTGYTDIIATSSNTTIKITKVASTIFEITSAKATQALVFVELKNNTNHEIKSITLNFYEHGVKDLNTVEGIKVNVDLSTKVTSLLGEPDIKTASTDGLSEYWRYASKGIMFTIIKSSLIVNQIDLFSSNYFFTNSANLQVSYTNYPYEIGNGWKINSSTTMEMVVAQFGTPTIKGTSTTSTTNRFYQYSNQKIVFRFYSDSEDNYTGKKIILFSAY